MAEGGIAIRDQRLARESIDPFDAESSATGDEGAGNFAGISSTSAPQAVADTKHGETREGRGKGSVAAPLLHESFIGHKPRVIKGACTTS